MRCERFYQIWKDEVDKVLDENPKATGKEIASRIATRLGCATPSASKVSRILRYIDFCDTYGLDMGRISEHTIRRVLALPDKYHTIIGKILAILMKASKKRIGPKTMDTVFQNLGIIIKKKKEKPKESKEYVIPEEYLKPVPVQRASIIVTLTPDEYTAISNAAMKLGMNDTTIAYIAIRNWLMEERYL